MVSALEAPDTRGRRKTQASKSTWKSHNHIRRTKSFGFFWKLALVTFSHSIPIRMLWLRSVFVWAHVNDRTYICEGSWKKHLMEDVSWPTGHDNARIKTLGKLKERWSVKPTKQCVVAVNQIWYLICNLINIKSGKISMFSGRCRGRVGETLLENDKETQRQKPAWVLCLFRGNCALTPQTNGARSSFPSTQPQSTVR